LYSQGAPKLAIKNFFLPYKVAYDQPAYWEAFEGIFTGFNMSDHLKENAELYDLSILHQVLLDNLPKNYMDSVKTDNVREIVSALRKDEVGVGYKPIFGELTNLNGVTFPWNKLYYNKVYIIVANSSLRESLSDIQYFKKMQERITQFIIRTSKIERDELDKIMHSKDELISDVGSVLIGKEAVDCGLIDEVGGLREALSKLRELIKEDSENQEKDNTESKDCNMHEF
jgi:hypothetical protein